MRTITKNQDTPLFTFDEGAENINGRYIRGTHVIENGVVLLILCLILLLILVSLCIAALINWEYFTSEGFRANSARSGFLYARAAGVLIMPVAIMGALFFPYVIVILILHLWPDGKGWTVKDNALTKWRAKVRNSENELNRQIRLFYFSTITRYSMPVDVFEDKFAVYLPGGKQDVLYEEMYKAFIYRDLFVFRAYQDEKSWDIIIDLRGKDKQTQKDFRLFMKEKFVEFRKTYVHEPWVKRSPFSQY